MGYSGRLTNPVNGALLIELATETGGHAYNAPEINGLTTLLDTESPLTFSRTEIDTAAGTATLKIRNNQDGVVTWLATESLAWLTVSPASGAVPARQTDESGVVVEPGVRDVNLTLSAGLAAGDYEGTISIVSADGNATVTVKATVAAGGVFFRADRHTGDAGGGTALARIERPACADLHVTVPGGRTHL